MPRLSPEFESRLAHFLFLTNITPPLVAIEYLIKMPFWNKETAISSEEDNEIEIFLRNWYEREFKGLYLYHGTSIFYDEIIRRQGLNPKKHPYEKRMVILFTIFHKIKRVYPKLVHQLLEWNAIYNRSSRFIYFTPNKTFAINEFLDKNLGGEILRFSLWSIGKIRKKYEENGKLMRLLLSEKEIKFLDDFERWANRVQRKGFLSRVKKGILIKVKWSSPSFNSRCVFSRDKHYFAPMGDYSNFKETLKNFFKSEKMTWCFNSITQYFSDKILTDIWGTAGWPCDTVIRPGEIEIEYF